MIVMAITTNLRSAVQGLWQGYSSKKNKQAAEYSNCKHLCNAILCVEAEVKACTGIKACTEG